MNETSDEQKIVVTHVKTGKNVIVDACAGSGKSTTILSAAKEIPNKKFIQLTYNSTLRHEVKDKIKQLELENIKVHTYHSLAVRYYLPTAYTDSGIRKILYLDMPPVTSIPPFNIVVLDEAQDMSFLYYQLICKFIRDMGTPFQLLVMGDYMQGLYDFKGADTRFLTHADKIWAHIPTLSMRDFVKCTLKMSYRVTQPMADFVNQAMLGEQRLLACRDGCPVTYVTNSRYNIEKIVTYEVSQLLANGVLPSEIFILGGSVKGVNSNIRRMENVLVEQGVPCHVPMLENDKIDERVIDGKVVFSTFHSVKGRQRKYVFIVGFDQSYFSIFSRNSNTEICPNTLYVGTTRATHGLYLLENNDYSTDRPLDFLKMGHHDMKGSPFIQFKGVPRSIFYKREESETANTTKKFYVTPTDLIKFISESVLEEISPILDRIFVSEETGLQPIEIPTITQTKSGFYEDVSDLNGIAIPCIYYDIINELWNPEEENEKVLLTMIQTRVSEMKQNEHGFLKKIVRELPPECNTISEYLYLSNVYTAIQEKLYFKLKQISIDEYNWLNDDVIEACGNRLDTIIGKESLSEKPVIEKTIISGTSEVQHSKIDTFLSDKIDNATLFRFTARVDLITEKSIWEIKCTSSISVDHLLQVVIYAWLYKMLDEPDGEKYFKIFNIKTGEVMVLESTMEELDTIIVALLKSKYGHVINKTDEEFIEDCISNK